MSHRFVSYPRTIFFFDSLKSTISYDNYCSTFHVKPISYFKNVALFELHKVLRQVQVFLFFYLFFLWTREKIILNVNKYNCNFLQFCNYFDVWAIYYKVVTVLFVLRRKHNTSKIHWKFKSSKEQTWKNVIISVLKRHEMLTHS